MSCFPSLVNRGWTSIVFAVGIWIESCQLQKETFEEYWQLVDIDQGFPVGVVFLQLDFTG